MMRPLTPVERELANAIIDALPDQTAQAVRVDFARSHQVDDENGDGSRLVFDIEGYDRPEDTGQHPLPAEGKLKDDDGTEMTASLYIDRNDRLYELEIIRWGDGPIIQPNLSSLRIY